MGALPDRESLTSLAPLTAALDDAAVDVIMAAAKSLTRLADYEVTGDVDSAEIGAVLRNAFRALEQKGRGGFDQWWIIDALERFDPAEVVDVLVEAINSSRRDSRMVVVKRLGKLGDRRAIEPLNRLSDQEWTVLGLLSRDTGLTCPAAIETLAEIADLRAAAPMVTQLRSQHDRVRAEAENTIVAVADDAAIAVLVALLGEDLPDWLEYDGDRVSPPLMKFASVLPEGGPIQPPVGRLRSDQIEFQRGPRDGSVI